MGRARQVAGSGHHVGGFGHPPPPAWLSLIFRVTCLECKFWDISSRGHLDIVYWERGEWAAGGLQVEGRGLAAPGRLRRQGALLPDSDRSFPSLCI